jgi:hypothetical protein
MKAALGMAGVVAASAAMVLAAPVVRGRMAELHADCSYIWMQAYVGSDGKTFRCEGEGNTCRVCLNES